MALLVAPDAVGRLLLGGELRGLGVPVARVAGVALLSLGVACWPGRHSSERRVAALRAMLIYNGLIALYLGALGVGGQQAGPLLWPAVVLHGALAVLLAVDGAWR